MARRLVTAMMRDAGLTPAVDAACNIVGRRTGRQPDAPPISFGSHIDTVPNGGRFDGILGCLAGIECVHTLVEAGITTHHPLEVIVFANEEGQSYTGLSGSKALAGALDTVELERNDANGRSFAAALQDFGGDPLGIRQAARSVGDIRAYIELHVEQGGVLESAGVPIGVVEGIVGIVYHDIRITGAANHAGTTPMALRRDALVAASKFIVAVNDTIRTGEYCAVGTVGKIDVQPNSRNVIPGDVRLILGLRDLQLPKVWRAVESLKEQARRIASDHNVEFVFTARETTEPAIADANVMGAIRTAAEAADLSWKIMPSGAGHDAQMMARLAPMGMIFVPSAGGVSHADTEFTSFNDCVNGANVLLGAIQAIDNWR
jgi:beta-ureidopropionase / N-carbamoyl-L-amino-acid hydrolase